MQRFLAAAEVLDDRNVAVIAATRGVKRDQNDVDPNGILLDNYRRNPVWLWQHSPDSPVAYCSAISVVNGELRAVCTFPPDGASALSDQCFSLVRAGVIRSCSIGFDVKEMQPINKAKPRGGQLITRCELLEISWVAVPADPDALVMRAIQGNAARFASLQRVPEASLQRALAQIPRRSDKMIMSHAGHVWALVEQRRLDEEERSGYAARQEQLRRLRGADPTRSHLKY